MIDRPLKRFYEFDQFRIDVEERQLLRSDGPIHLTPKVFDILLTLVENNGHTIDKDKLMESVWAEAFVEEGNLNRNISTLRKILGEGGHDPRFIKTVPKRGYRFDWDVREIVEEDEELIVEKRTKYHVAVREESVPQRFGNTEEKTFSPRFFMYAGSVVALLIFGFALVAIRTPTSDANSLMATDGARRGGTNAEAFELYQQGRALWQNRSVEGLHQATLNFEQAIYRDPEFALAHAALADAYAFDVLNWMKAEAVANEAIRLDPNLGQPYATIGFVRMFWEQKLRQAEPYFKTAITLDANYATAHQWYAINLTARSQGGSGLAEIKRALEIEPDSLAINADMCQILYFSRKYDQAIDQCQKTLEMDANFLNAHQYLYEIYTAKEMYPEAVNEYLKTEELNMTTKTYPNQIEDLKTAYATGGIRAFWREQIEMLNKPDEPAAYSIGQYYARLGEKDEALKWLKRASKSREFGFLFFAVDPAMQSLLADPRSKDLSASLDG